MRGLFRRGGARPPSLHQAALHPFMGQCIRMRRALISVALAALLVGVLACCGRKRAGDQGAAHLPGPADPGRDLPAPASACGRSRRHLLTTLRLFAVGNVLGFPNNTPMGTMAFQWGPLNGSCSTSAASCSGTTNLETTTKLPGGTITANGNKVSLAKGLVVPIQSGTGIFKGVKGTVFIAPGGNAVDVFKLVMAA